MNLFVFDVFQVNTSTCSGQIFFARIKNTDFHVQTII